MIKSILVFLIFIFFYSCKQSTPSGIIKQEKMQQILWDIFRAEALSQEIVKNDSAKLLINVKGAITDKIFLIHHITEDQFKKSCSFYIKHPDIMKTMLDSINNQQSLKVNLPFPNKMKRGFDSTTE